MGLFATALRLPRNLDVKTVRSEISDVRWACMIQGLISIYIRVLGLPKHCHCRVKVRELPPPLLRLPLHPRRRANQTALGITRVPKESQDKKKESGLR